MRNPNPEWKTTLDNRCQARMEELSNMAIISNPVKTVPGYAISRFIMEDSHNGLIQQYTNRDTALLVLLTHDAVNLCTIRKILKFDSFNFKAMDHTSTVLCQ